MSSINKFFGPNAVPYMSTKDREAMVEQSRQSQRADQRTMDSQDHPRRSLAPLNEFYRHHLLQCDEGAVSENVFRALTDRQLTLDQLITLTKRVSWQRAVAAYSGAVASGTLDSVGTLLLAEVATKVCRRHGAWAGAFMILSDQELPMKSDTRIASQILDHAIRACTPSGKWMASVSFFASLEQVGVQNPSDDAYSSVVEACSNAGEQELAELFFETYRQTVGRGKRVDIEERNRATVYNAMMQAYLADGRWTKAMQVFARMESDGVSPTSGTYPLVISSLGYATPARWLEAAAVASVAYQDRDSTHDLKVAVAFAYGRAGQLARSLMLLEVTPQPSPQLVHSVMRACNENDAWQAAIACFKRLSQCIPPRHPERFPLTMREYQEGVSSCYEQLFAACRDAERAVLAATVFPKQLWTSDTASHFLQMLVRTGKHDSAVGVFHSAAEMDMALTQDAYGAALSACSQANKWRLAVTVFGKLVQPSTSQKCIVHALLREHTAAANAPGE